ncbi:MAG: hypothetical protein IH626_14350 [Rhodospirillales bacterium]|nr:hypothetical protein [Rhodospirillales bacterium]
MVAVLLDGCGKPEKLYNPGAKGNRFFFIKVLKNKPFSFKRGLDLGTQFA